jgi:branched-chain amino acid transport system substrate-binding protein
MEEELMRHGRSIRYLLALAVSLGVVATSAAQGVVKLPIVVEVTGGGAAVGAMWRDAVNLAVEDINRKGGILGMRLETSVQDTQTDPPTSVAVMRRVINDKPFAVFGTVYSSSTVANMDIARQAGIPQFTGSESVVITQKGNDNIFTTSFTQDVGMAKFVRWLLEDLKAEKVAVVWVNNAFGKGGRDMFLQFMKERGKVPVADISTEVQQADFTPELIKVRASGATHVMVYSHEEENARFMIQLRKLGLAVQPVGETTLCTQTTITPGGAAINGARCHVGLVATAPVPLMADMSRRFQEKFNRVPDHNALKGYIGVHMLKAAVQRVGSWDQAKVRTCLHNNVFTTAEEPGLLMDVYVNEKGSLDRPSFIVEVKDEKPVVAKTVGMLGGPYTTRPCR